MSNTANQTWAAGGRPPAMAAQAHRGVSTGQVPVSDKPTPIVQTGADTVRVKNAGDVTLWVGNESVSLHTGYPLGLGEEITINARDSRDYAVAPAGMSGVVAFQVEA